MAEQKRTHSTVDLHIHSSLSDGNNSPEVIAKMASEMGLSAISITDHDTLFPEEYAIALSKQYNIEVVPGIEFSALSGNCNIHILGYYLNEDSIELVSFLKHFRSIRAERAERMIDILRTLGVRISIEKAKRNATGGMLGRPHLADLLIESGYVADHSEAYRRYLGQEAPAYVTTDDTIVSEIISLIHGARGVAVMAHPGLGCSAEVIEHVINSGIDGLEIYHPKHSSEQIMKFRKLCKMFNLVKSGGSDHHGKQKWLTTIGKPVVPYSVLEEIKSASKEIKLAG